MTDVEVGRITITMRLTDDDQLVNVDFDDDLAVVSVLGMLDLARDTVLHPPAEEDD